MWLGFIYFYRAVAEFEVHKADAHALVACIKRNKQMLDLYLYFSAP